MADKIQLRLGDIDDDVTLHISDLQKNSEQDDEQKLNEEENISDWELIQSKRVKDYDGFFTDYTMWYNNKEHRYGFVFGDNDVYTPDNTDLDWDELSKSAAEQWFDSYDGYEEEDEFEDDDLNEQKLIEYGNRNSGGNNHSNFKNMRIHKIGDAIREIVNREASTDGGGTKWAKKEGKGKFYWYTSTGKKIPFTWNLLSDEDKSTRKVSTVNLNDKHHVAGHIYQTLQDYFNAVLDKYGESFPGWDSDRGIQSKNQAKRLFDLAEKKTWDYFYEHHDELFDEAIELVGNIWSTASTGETAPYGSANENKYVQRVSQIFKTICYEAYRTEKVQGVSEAQVIYLSGWIDKTRDFPVLDQDSSFFREVVESDNLCYSKDKKRILAVTMYVFTDLEKQTNISESDKFSQLWGSMVTNTRNGGNKYLFVPVPLYTLYGEERIFDADKELGTIASQGWEGFTQRFFRQYFDQYAPKYASSGKQSTDIKSRQYTDGQPIKRGYTHKEFSASDVPDDSYDDEYIEYVSDEEDEFEESVFRKYIKEDPDEDSFDDHSYSSTQPKEK